MLRQPALFSRAGTTSAAASFWPVRYAASTSTSKLKSRAKPKSKSKSVSASLGTANRLNPPLIAIERGTFYNSYPSSGSTEPDPANPPLFHDIDFVLGSRQAKWPEPRTSKKSSIEKARRELEKELEIRKELGPFHWAVIGPGSTTFLNILQGQYIAVPPKSRSYKYLSSSQFVPNDPKLRHPSNAIQYVGFSGEGSQATGGTRGAYLSARYESLREETDWTVLQYLKGQTELNPLESEETVNLYDETFFQEVAQNLRLGNLLDMPVSNLSNGQTRRTRIAKALLAKPELLLLDEPFMGLDPATTDSISSLLCNLANKSSPRVLLSLRPQDPVPEWITHVMLLGGDTISFQGDKKAYFSFIKKSQSQGVLIQTQQKVRLSNNDLSQLTESLTDEADSFSSAPRTPISLNGEPILEMNGVNVQYGDKVVLGDWKQEVLNEDNIRKGLQWKVRRGQRWAVLGANGSGKTTLLSVITSDHPQAYALPVRMFGRARLPEPGRPAISIFDLQARMGHSSPEIHAFFPRQLTLRASIESAWADTFLAKPTLSYEIDILVDRVLEHFKPEFDPQPIKSNGADLSFIPEPFQKRILPEESFPDRRWKTKPAILSLDDSIQYAESLTFGQLTVAQQRLVLFIRAIIKKQDLIILDEAFAGMPASMREKCFDLLNNGGPPEKGAEKEKEGTCTPQLPYLGPEQSLIVVSHLREEIPDSVRFWMRLPSEVGDDKKLQFALGVVPDSTTLSSDEDAWKTLWSENSLARANLQSSAAEGEEIPNDAEKFGYVIPRVAD